MYFLTFITEAKFDIKDCTPQNFDSINLATKEAQERNYQIMQNFAKALWSVLKQHNEKLKVRQYEEFVLNVFQ